jgi:hypothetical protein
MWPNISIGCDKRAQGRVNPQPPEPGARPRPIFISDCWDDGKHDRGYMCNCQKEKAVAVCAGGTLAHQENTPISLATASSLPSDVEYNSFNLSAAGYHRMAFMLIPHLQLRRLLPNIEDTRTRCSWP